LHVDRAAQGRVVIEFSGTAEQVKAAFRTKIRKFGLPAPKLTIICDGLNPAKLANFRLPSDRWLQES
jgi:hypothetical protein